MVWSFEGIGQAVKGRWGPKKKKGQRERAERRDEGRQREDEAPFPPFSVDTCSFYPLRPRFFGQLCGPTDWRAWLANAADIERFFFFIYNKITQYRKYPAARPFSN